MSKDACFLIAFVDVINTSHVARREGIHIVL